MYNIRVEVPCTEIVRKVILTQFRNNVIDVDTLVQDNLNIDIVSFNQRRNSNQHINRNAKLKVLLNLRHSERYKPQKTEAALARALESRAYESLLHIIAGAYQVTGSVSQSLNVALSFYQLDETEKLFVKESLRKTFARWRESQNIC